MGKVFILSLFMLFVFSDIKKSSSAEINISLMPEKVVLSHEKTKEQIKQMMLPKIASNSIVMGMTSTHLKPTVKIIYESFKNKVKVNSIDIKMGYPQLTVYIAKDYKKGSCNYRAVLQHEKRHIEISMDALRRITPSLRPELKSRVEFQPISGNTEEAIKKWEKIISAIILKKSNEINEFAKGFHDRFDDRELKRGRLC